MSIDVSVVLPRLQFLHKGAGLVFSADDGFLEGLDDGGDFMLLMSFLGEDDRIGDLRNTLLGGGHSSRLSGGRSGLDVLGLAGTDDGGEVFASCVDIELGRVVVVNDFGVDESRFTHTIGTKKAQIRLKKFADLSVKEYAKLYLTSRVKDGAKLLLFCDICK